MMKKRQDIDKFGVNYSVSTFQLILKDCARLARAEHLAAAKAKFRRASLKLKVLGTQEILDAMANQNSPEGKPRSWTVGNRRKINPRKLYEENGIYIID